MMTNYVKLIVILVLAAAFCSPAGAQDARQRQNLLRMAEEFSARFEQQKAEAADYANRLGIPLRQELEDGTVMELMRLENGVPLYYITHNANGATYIKSDKVYPGGSAGLSLTGSGQTLGIWDGGKVLSTHQELTGRVTQQDGATILSDHSTHVAGTMIASGVVVSAKGMSFSASLWANDWNDDQAEMATAAASGLKVSQHSYGYITGWASGDWSGSSGWHWWGNPTVSEVEDHNYGYYDSYAFEWDEIAYNAPHYLIVKSAGNDRGKGPAPGTGHYVRNPNNDWNWEWSTTTRDKNGGTDGYDCITRNGNAKNIMSVGAVSSAGAMASFSSWGPTDDGRVKPDIVAKGISVYSSGYASNASYVYKSGTSMSGPMVSGSVGLLLHHQENLHPGEPLLASTIKALIIHTADEMISGAAGPDYRFGWGLMNTEAAAAVMSDNALISGNHIYELVLNDGEEITIPVKSNGALPLKATIVWTDVPGTTPDPELNPTSLMLVNDLDMRLTASDATEYRPYILDPANPSFAATTGDNFRDNVEKINIESPGTDEIYLLTIRHKGNLTGGSQQFSLIVTGNDPFEYTGSTLASDQSSNYTSWSDNSNRGFGFDPWDFTSGGSGGAYLGSTGLGSNSFGIYSGQTGSGNYFVAGRNFEEVMPVTSTFSVELGYTGVATGGEIGITLFSESNFRLVIKFVGGSSDWVINDGGSDFGTGIPWAGNTPLHFEFTRSLNNGYSLKITQGAASFNAADYVSSSGVMSIDRIEIYTSGQGSGENLGFDNLMIYPDINGLPEDATLLVNSNITQTGELKIGSLLISEGNNYQIDAGAKLEVTGDLLNFNSGAKSGDGLIIKSDATGTGSLIHSTTGVQATVERYIEKAGDWSGEAVDWHFLSAPVVGQAISGGWTPTGINGDYDFYAWDESQPSYPWRNQKDGSNGIVDFLPGQGFLVSYENTYTRLFSGELQAGTISVTLQHEGTQSWKGFNLLGNPYPSAIDWNLVSRELFEDDFVYIYNRNRSGSPGYVTVDGVTAGALVPAHQGFFVKAKATSHGGEFLFEDITRKHGTSFLKSGNKSDQKIVLRLSNGEFYDETTVRFHEQSQFTRDRADALKMFGFSQAAPQVYTLTEDGIQVEINTIPEVNSSVVIPLGISVPANQMLTIEAIELSGIFAENTVVLFDQKTGFAHRFNENPVCQFPAVTNDDPNRFLLKYEMVGVNELPATEKVNIYSHGQNIFLNSPESTEVLISVYNITGQQVYSQRTVLDGLKQINLNLPSGWYVVKATTGNWTKSSKLFIK